MSEWQMDVLFLLFSVPRYHYCEIQLPIWSYIIAETLRYREPYLESDIAKKKPSI